MQDRAESEKKQAVVLYYTPNMPDRPVYLYAVHMLLFVCLGSITAYKKDDSPSRPPSLADLLFFPLDVVIHLLHVLEIFKRIDQLLERRYRVRRKGNVVLRKHRDLRDDEFGNAGIL